MDLPLYLAARAAIALVQGLPLPWVARLGRAAGGLAYWLDARHRRMARQNLAAGFPEKSAAEITALARENFRRLGENFACAIKTASMSPAALAPHLELHLVERLSGRTPGGAPISCVFAIGHFGNFEIHARAAQHLPGVKVATTYRALPQPRLNRLLQDLRGQSGCHYFERRFEGDQLRQFIARQKVILGLLCDQHGGRRGFRLPFFGRECSTNPAPAVLALRYRLPLFTAFCFRTRLAHWRLEMGPEIPTHQNGRPRPVADIMREVNLAFEQAIRRDPANWFWVHNRWKTLGRELAPKQRDEAPAVTPS
jgi:KDO2-lipid IV(A) lauroyltransferase